MPVSAQSLGGFRARNAFISQIVVLPLLFVAARFVLCQDVPVGVASFPPTEPDPVQEVGSLDDSVPSVPQDLFGEAIGTEVDKSLLATMPQGVASAKTDTLQLAVDLPQVPRQHEFQGLPIVRLLEQTQQVSPESVIPPPAVALPGGSFPTVPDLQGSSAGVGPRGELPRGSLQEQQLLQPAPEELLPTVLGTQEPWRRLPSSSEKISQLTLEELGHQITAERILQERQALSVDLPYVLSLALLHSKNIKVQRILPAEARQAVNQEFGRFDWRGFLEGLFAQDAQPVSVVGQTSRPISQVRNDQHGVSFGLRRQTYTGGEVELSQRLGVADSNSGLLSPAEPGESQVAITFSQELLRDGGRDVVLSQALIASLRADIRHTEAFAEISDLLQAVYVQYWDLYQRRGDYFIQRSLALWAEETLRLLEARGKFDAEQNSIEQARALLREAEANLENARAAVLISQDRMYRLVNAPELDSNQVELLTIQPVQSQARYLEVMPELQVAIASRSEISGKLLEIRSAAVTHHVSLNQLLPRLTMYLESSMNGIDDHHDFWDAQRKMFDVDPSYSAGLNLEFFIANRTAKAQNKRAQLALRRLQYEYEDLVEQVRLEVATAIRTLNASTQILEQRRLTLEARQVEIASLRQRREVVAQQGVSPSLLLEQFFQAINRLVLSQQAYVAAVKNQQAAFADLLRAKGVLLQATEIPRDFNVGVPNLRNAYREQRETKPDVRNEVRERVIMPGRRQVIPVLK